MSQNRVKKFNDSVLERLRAGDKGVMTVLYEQYWEGLMCSCYKVLQNYGEAQDLVQEVFLLVWEKRNQISIKKDIGAYLHGVLRFKVFNHLKTSRRYSSAVEQMAMFLKHTESAVETPASLLEQNELYHSIREIVVTLPERCRMVYEMREEDKSYQEIADQLDCSVKTVENQLAKARRHLRAALNHFLFTVLFTCILANVFFSFH